MKSQVGTGMVVRIHYTLRDEGGEVIDSSFQSQPLEYLHGAGNIVAGLESALIGAAVGERRRVSVPPEQGYGIARPDAIHAFPRDAFPAELDLQPGMQFSAEAEDGQVLTVWVHSAEGDQVMIDFNHPLAGKVLDFEVQIEAVRAASDEEIAHGHPHGPHGHHH
jgi:FKBP-type peptidyl-prolyl cis-trans isomerase SlyD